MAEQLVAVPTVLSNALLQQRTVEQIIDIPVPRHGGRRSLQGFLPDMVPDSVLWNRTLVVVLLVVVMVYDRACLSELWNRPQTFLSLVVVLIKVSSRNRFQQRFLELNMSMEVQFPVNVLIMDIFKALLQDKVQQLVVELIFTRCCRRMWWMRSRRNEWLLMYFCWRGPVLWCSSRNSPSCMTKVAGSGLGLCGALTSPTSSATALARCASSSRTRGGGPLCQCRVEQQTLSFHPSSRRGVRWRTFEFTDDDPKAAHLLVVFASEELALQSKDAFEAAQASLAQ